MCVLHIGRLCKTSELYTDRGKTEREGSQSRPLYGQYCPPLLKFTFRSLQCMQRICRTEINEMVQESVI